MMKNLLTRNLAVMLGMTLGASTAFAQPNYETSDFENGIPVNWVQFTDATDGGWIAGTGEGLSSGSFEILPKGNIIATNDDGCNCDKAGDTLMTDVIDLTATTGDVSLIFDLYYAELTYDGDVEDFFIYVKDLTNSTWTQVYDGQQENALFWKLNESVSLSSYAGSEIEVAFIYDDNDGWLFGAALDNVGIIDMSADDGFNNSIDNELLIVDQANTIEGTIYNSGSSTITSMDIEYTVGSGSPVSGSMTGLSVAPGATYDYSHPVAFTPSTMGATTLTTEIVTVNGSSDMTFKNTETVDVQVTPEPVQRKPLLEQFTSSTCPPCLPGNENVLAILPPYAGEYSKVNYQMSWPGSGDPYFTDEGGVRRQFYAVNSVPSMHTDGSAGLNSNNYTAGVIENAIASPAFMNLTVSAAIQPMETYEVQDGELVKVDSSYHLVANMSVNPVMDIPAGNRAFMSIQENLTDENVKSNGETVFHDVMKKMLPDASGTALSAINEGDTFSHMEEFDFVGSYRLPNNAGDPIQHSMEHSIEEWDDLHVVAWVQDPNNANIWQSENAEVELLETETNVETDSVDGVVVYTVDGTEYEMFGDKLSPLNVNSVTGEEFAVFPNPAQGMINISGTLGMVNVTIHDMNGRQVMSTISENTAVDVSHLTPGMYTITVKNSNKSFTERLTIVR